MVLCKWEQCVEVEKHESVREATDIADPIQHVVRLAPCDYHSWIDADFNAGELVIALRIRDQVVHPEAGEDWLFNQVVEPVNLLLTDLPVVGLVLELRESQ